MSQSQIEGIRTDAGAAGLSTSDWYRLLAASRRRVALDILVDRTAPVDLEDLAGAIAARETNGGEVDESLVEEVALTLHHVHLPMLADSGVIDYDLAVTLVESCPRCPDS